MLEVVEATEASKWMKAIFYGAPGTGKTRAATAYPKEFGKGIYVALDEGSDRLDSVLKQYRPRLVVVKFKGDDPIKNLNEVAIHDWRKEYSDANVLIIDTFTKACRDILAYSANKGFFAGKKGDQHVQFGPKDAAISQAIPGMGDYMGVQSLVYNWTRLLFQHQANMHVIVVCHEDVDYPGTESPADARPVGGPSTVGRALLRSFPSEFPVVVRFDVRALPAQQGQPAKAEYTAISAMHGYYTARIREGNANGNPIPRIPLNVDPANWWDAYSTHFLKEEVTK